MSRCQEQGRPNDAPGRPEAQCHPGAASALAIFSADHVAQDAPLLRPSFGSNTAVLVASGSDSEAEYRLVCENILRGRSSSNALTVSICPSDILRGGSSSYPVSICFFECADGSPFHLFGNDGRLALAVVPPALLAFRFNGRSVVVRMRIQLWHLLRCWHGRSRDFSKGNHCEVSCGLYALCTVQGGPPK